MHDLVLTEEQGLPVLPPPTPEIERQLEVALLAAPQAACYVIHHFGPGTYIRELSMPAGTIAVGHEQRFEQMNIVLQGAAAVVGQDGAMREVRAPALFVGPPGRKVGTILEDIVWQNVFAADERDVELLEERFFLRSPEWRAAVAARLEAERPTRQRDRDDYLLMLEQYGIPQEIVTSQTENADDQIPLPLGSYRFKVGPSAIEGLGLHATAPIAPFEVIAPARIAGKRTPAGRYANHSPRPNALMVPTLSGDINLVAARPIAGSLGGGVGDEITVDYRQVLSLGGRLPIAKEPK